MAKDSFSFMLDYSNSYSLRGKKNYNLFVCKRQFKLLDLHKKLVALKRIGQQAAFRWRLAKYSNVYLSGIKGK